MNNMRANKIKALPWLLFAILATLTAWNSAEYVIGNDSLPYIEAKEYCEEEGGHLWLPRVNTKIHQDILKLIQYSWVDLQVQPSFWQSINDNQVLHDQGCYSHESILATGRMSFVNNDTCPELCQNSGYEVYGLQTLRPWRWDCLCLNKISMAHSLPDYMCSAQCPGDKCGTTVGDSYRVYAIKGNATAPLPSWKFNHRLPANSRLCASIMANGSTVNLIPNECSQKLASLCINPEDGSLHGYRDTMPWIQSFQYCKSINQSLVSLMSLKDALTRQLAENVSYWTALTAWALTSHSRGASQKNMLKWFTGGNQVSLEHGVCMLATKHGSLTSASCMTEQPFVCDISEVNTSVVPPSNQFNNRIILAMSICAPLIVASLLVVPLLIGWKIWQRSSRTTTESTCAVTYDGEGLLHTVVCSHETPYFNNPMYCTQEMVENGLYRRESSVRRPTPLRCLTMERNVSIGDDESSL